MSAQTDASGADTAPLLVLSPKGIHTGTGSPVQVFRPLQIKRLLLFLACHREAGGEASGRGATLPDKTVFEALGPAKGRPENAKGYYESTLSVLKKSLLDGARREESEDALGWTARYWVRGVEVLRLVRERGDPATGHTVRLDFPNPARVRIEDMEPFLASLRKSPPEREEAPAPRHNLPAPLSSFIGREKEVAAVRAFLGHARLVTLTGAGGCGKTRLSLEVGAALREDFEDGVFLVELAPLSDGSRIARTVADVLNVREEDRRPIEETIKEALASRHLLLLLDNCEHLIAAAARWAGDVLQTCPRLTVLATSREPLNVTGEVVYRVPSLSLPPPTEPGEAPLPPERLTQFEAVRLFIARAVAARADFAVTNANAPTLAELCVRLDGIPLAIELAAARVRALSLEQIAGRLDDRFRLLTGGNRAAMPRQQTLRALIDWSYDLLSPGERLLLARLAVFVGGWTLPAAEAVCGFEPLEEAAILDALTGLVDKSLVLAEEHPAGDAVRYRMLESVHAYAGERLQASGEWQTLSERHGDWCTTLSVQAEKLLKGQETRAWLARVDADLDNLRAALRRSLADPRPGAGDAALRISTNLFRFWHVRGRFSEGREWLEQALSRRGESKRPGGVAYGLLRFGAFAQLQGDFEVAVPSIEEALARFREENNHDGVTSALINLGHIAEGQGEYGRARATFEETLAICRASDDKVRVARLLNVLGGIARVQGDFPAAVSLLRESVTLRRELGDDHTLSISLYNLALALEEVEQSPSAVDVMRESLNLCQSLGDRDGIAYAQSALGNMALNRRDVAGAEPFLTQGLALSREIGSWQTVANCLTGLGRLARQQDDLVRARSLFRESAALLLKQDRPFELAVLLDGMGTILAASAAPRQAAVCWGAAERLRDSTGAVLPPRLVPEVYQGLEEAKAQLGEGPFAEAWEEGRALTGEQRGALLLPKPPAPKDGAESPPAGRPDASHLP